MFLRIVFVAFMLSTQSVAQTTDTAATPNYPSPDQAQSAVQFVISRYTLDPSVNVPATGKPLPTDGKWSVRKTPPASCPPTTNSCLGVVYTTADGMACEWTVLLKGKDPLDSVIDQSDETSRYFVLRLTPQEVAANVLTKTKPVYPGIAQAAHMAGKVELSVFIDPTGNVVRVVSKSGPSMLIGAASDAAKAWKFKPPLVGTRPVNAVANVSMEFSTQGPGRSKNKPVSTQSCNRLPESIFYLGHPFHPITHPSC